MTTLYMMRGLPASGKSTKALEMLKKGATKRVNKDLLREMLDGSEHSPEKERLICTIRDSMIISMLKLGFDVISDDTNLNPKHEMQLRDLANYVGADFIIIDIDTPLDVCIERDSKRAKHVGESVIRHMYDMYLAVK